MENFPNPVLSTCGSLGSGKNFWSLGWRHTCSQVLWFRIAAQIVSFSLSLSLSLSLTHTHTHTHTWPYNQGKLPRVCISSSLWTPIRKIKWLDYRIPEALLALPSWTLRDPHFFMRGPFIARGQTRDTWGLSVWKLVQSSQVVFVFLFASSKLASPIAKCRRPLDLGHVCGGVVGQWFKAALGRPLWLRRQFCCLLPETPSPPGQASLLPSEAALWTNPRGPLGDPATRPLGLAGCGSGNWAGRALRSRNFWRPCEELVPNPRISSSSGIAGHEGDPVGAGQSVGLGAVCR